MSAGRALVTGAAGQDGSYLVESLLARGYDVVGVVLDASVEIGEAQLVEVDLLDADAVVRLLREHRPQEVYNLASPSFVPRSWEHPLETAGAGTIGVTALLEAVRAVDDEIRLFQASSSEIFGEPVEVPQTEATPLAPLTPYGAAKAYAHFLVRAYRRRYGLHASSGILYNHESPRRPETFLPSKVAHAVVRIERGEERELVLGDLDAQRDWGYACDYVEAMRLVVQQNEPDDYVIASGEQHSVRELVELAFAHAGLDWREHVRVDESLKRGPSELHHLVGDASKARERLGWAPTLTFQELVALLVDAARAG
ncbi:MAG TPA: GDP-mannose 4,6-dehydratase [Gaiellaceae bacterium]|nr:GDP-mannose 4,6-dehydratase [Gaiellaceae bacterium]